MLAYVFGVEINAYNSCLPVKRRECLLVEQSSNVTVLVRSISTISTRTEPGVK